MKMNLNKSRIAKGIFKDDRAVSPVIAVILMVAITVVMAAIVSSWSAGVKAPTAPTTVGLDINRQGNNITVVVTTVDPASSEPLNSMNISYKYWNGTVYTTNTTDAYLNSVYVGDSKVVNTGISTPSLLIIKVTFKDASSKVLYSREV